MDPFGYGSKRKAKTRSADPTLILKAKGYGFRQLMRESGASQHATERFVKGQRVHPRTRIKLEEAIKRLEQTPFRRLQRSMSDMEIYR